MDLLAGQESELIATQMQIYFFHYTACHNKDFVYEYCLRNMIDSKYFCKRSCGGFDSLMAECYLQLKTIWIVVQLSKETIY